MAPNQHYIAKADLELQHLTDEGGALVPEQAKQFLEIAIAESELLQLVQVQTMQSPTFEIPKIGFTGSVLRPGTERTGLSESDRSKPALDKVTLSTKEFVGEVRIPYSVVEDNIMQGTFLSYAQDLLAKAVARDIERVVVEGDTTSSDPLLKTLDGVLKQASSQVYNAGGVRMSPTVIQAMTRAMPKEYYKAAKLAVLTSKNAVIDYVASLSDRQTPMGDSQVGNFGAALYGQTKVIAVPVFPEELGSGNKTNALLCDPKNITVGIQRNIKIETEKDISAREYKMVVTVRFDVKWAHEPAVVKATEILASV